MKSDLLRLVAGGALSLAIAMGVGRFAYTPILPLMQHDLSISDAAAGYLASSNYAGYLLGAIAAGAVNWRGHAIRALGLGLFASIATTAGMGLTDQFAVWFVLRFLSGVSSALVFVLTSSVVLDALAASGRSIWSGVFYGGVGCGISLTGLIIPLLHRAGGWRGAWIGLAAISLCIGVAALLWLKERPSAQNTPAPSTAAGPDAKQRLFPWLVAAYGCEGLGYIVTGTFLVAIVARIPGMQQAAALSWVLAGLAAIPSCLFWSWAGKRWGEVVSLRAAMLLQTVGIAAPALSASPIAAGAGAVLFGGTFMGITTLATALARRLYPQRSSRVIGWLTAVYGAGQMVGPTAAGIIATHTRSFHAALIGAAVIVCLGALLLSAGQRLHPTHQTKKEAIYHAVRKH